MIVPNKTKGHSYQNHSLGGSAHWSGRPMGQRNVERHVCGELKEGYLSVEERIRSFGFSFNGKKEKEGNEKRETDANQQIAR